MIQELVPAVTNKDLLLMAYLRQNSRESLTRLSRKTGIPVSTIFDKIKKRKGSVIDKHVSLLHFEQLGYTVKVNVLLGVAKKERGALREFLSRIYNINNLARINNGYDFLFEAYFHNIKELEYFLDALDNKFTLRRKDVHYIIEDLKKEAFLSDPQLIPYT